MGRKVQRRHPWSEPRLARKGPSRATRRAILVVCEGEKTEPLYFNALKRDRGLGLTAVHVEVCGEECGSAPISVVRYAIRKFKDRAREAPTSGSKLPFEKVYCVMDKDQHASLDAALDLIEKSKGKIPIQGIVSCPCFELWFLLHFRYSARPYHAYADLQPDLVQHLPAYDKGAEVYQDLRPRMSQALAHCERLVAHHSGISMDRFPNPSTEVHHLIKALMAFPDPYPERWSLGTV